MESILAIAFRSIAVYLFIVLAIRIFGKKELAQLSVVDLVFILLISNSVQNAMVGDNSTLLGGLVAATSLFIVNMTLKNIFFKSQKISQLFQGIPLILVYHGKELSQNILQAKISHEELEAAVREHGVEKIKQVDLAVFEVDGNISVLSNNFRHKTVRRRKAHKVISKNQ